VRSESLAEHLRGLQRGTSRGDRRAAVPLDDDESGDETDERYEEIDDKRYEANPFRARTRSTGAMVSVSRGGETTRHPFTLTTHADVN
jgi:hypothetical protein